ncbi:MAG TPA: hypothetical protein VM370_09140 [Candidatus Thermoplasmatota archaeon]|nr:hypothetical protein [Candidatus Thermoplasmatota archaeon]
MSPLAFALLAIALAMPVAAADVPPVHACAEPGCAHVEDPDGDGDPDFVSVAASIGVASANVLVEGEELFAQGGATDDDVVEPVLAADAFVYVDTEHGVDEAWASATLVRIDEDTGASQTLATQTVVLSDTDDDGVPDHVTTMP